MDVEVGDRVVHKGSRGTVLEVDGSLILVEFDKNSQRVWVERKYVVRIHKVDDDIKLDVD